MIKKTKNLNSKNIRNQGTWYETMWIKKIWIAIKKHKQTKKIIAILTPKFAIIQNYYFELSYREKFLINALGIVFAIFFIFSIGSGIVNFTSAINTNYALLKQYQTDAIILKNQYDSINAASGNQFNEVKLERIKADATSILRIEQPSINLENDTLSVNIDNATFENVILFLDQMRTSYGLFPQKLKITSLASSGSVAFLATFIVPE